MRADLCQLSLSFRVEPTNERNEIYLNELINKKISSSFFPQELRKQHWEREMTQQNAWQQSTRRRIGANGTENDRNPRSPSRLGSRTRFGVPKLKMLGYLRDLELEYSSILCLAVSVSVGGWETSALECSKSMRTMPLV